MSKPIQPELLPPDRTTSTIVISGPDLAGTEQRLRAMGAVILGFSVKGSTYALSVILPPRHSIEQVKEGRQ
jgi:hypothetical protein